MRKMKPSFCYIAPVAYLDYTILESRTHLVLAHLVDTNKEYADFYKYRSEQLGDYIMMDNSAYELKEPYSPDKLVGLAKLCGAHAIVLPDYPFESSHVTIDAANEFIPQFKDAGYDTFFVPQSQRGDIDGWIDSYAYAANNPDIDIIGLSILGIPNALPHIDPSFSRVVMTQMLIDQGYFNFGKHHHYLGLNSGPKLEIPSLLCMNALDTIDSSGPIWSAITGHRYDRDTDSLQAASKVKMPVDFMLPLTKDAATKERILHNIKLTAELFDKDNYGKQAAWYAQE